MDEENNDVQEDLDWENRTLCSDESCIGTIGPNGSCNVCGKHYTGELPPDDYDDSVGSAEVDEEDFETEAIDEENDPDLEIDWESRTLCSDESCIGVIGSNGRCKECGKVFENG